MINLWVSSLCAVIIFRQHNRTRRDDVSILAAVLTISNGDIGLVHKQLLLRLGQQVPVPIADRIVQAILNIVDDYLLALLKFLARRSIVCILVWHDVQQLHRTVRGSRDG